MKIIDDIMVRSPYQKRGFMERPCQAYSYEDGEYTIFELEQTRRDFATMRFPLEKGALIKNHFGVYECVDVTFAAKRPKRAICKTKKIA